MKVYLVSLQFLDTISGGQGVHVTELARELVKKGVQTTVLTLGTRDQKRFEEVVLEDPYEKNEKLKKLKVPVHRFFVADSAHISNANSSSLEHKKDRSHKFSLQVTGFLRGQPDQANTIVHLHGHFMVPSMAKELKLATGFKIISTIHRAESIYEENGILSEHPDMVTYMEEKELDAINYSDTLIVRSWYIRDLLQELYQSRITNHRIEVLPSAVPMPFINEPLPSTAEQERIKEAYRIKGDLILSLNVIEPLKGLEYALQALPLVIKKLKKQKHDKDHLFTLIIAGHLTDQHNWYFSKLQKIVRKYVNPKMKKYVRFMTNIDPHQKDDLFNAASIFLHTSIAEPFGISIAEALVKNNIVITTNSEGPRLILDHDGTVHAPFTQTKYGLIIPMQDMTRRCEHISEAMVYAIMNKDKLKTQTHNAHDHVVKNFSWSNLINKKIAIYNRVLGRHP